MIDWFYLAPVKIVHMIWTYENTNEMNFWCRDDPKKSKDLFPLGSTTDKNLEWWHETIKYKYKLYEYNKLYTVK